MLQTSIIDKRKSPRSTHPESIIVKAKISEDEFWKEKAELISVSRLGAGFNIEKECKVGQIISLLIPMPFNLRSYDHDKQLYRIWGLVQHCHSYTSENSSGYNVGVAFIGKDAPASFYEKPDQSYRIVGLSEEGLWKITEAEREFINRKHPRVWANLEVNISCVDQEGELIENTGQTENVSRSGAAVFCETTAFVGDLVRFSCPQFEFECDAIVRNRRGNGNTIPKIHLEFIENEFPVEKIELHFDD